MYTGKQVNLRPLQPAFIMASTGEAVTYRELDARSNRLAHLFRKHGLKRLDHYSIFMENNSRYLEACGAGERSGLYFTCVNSYLTAGRTRLHPDQQRVPHPHHVEGKARRRARGDQGMSEDRALHRRRRRGRKRSHRRPAAGDRRTAGDADRGRICRHRDALFVRHHRAAEGHLAAVARAAAHPETAAVRFPDEIWQYREGMIYLSPAPLYHSAPQAAVNLTIQMGGTAIIMESFDPERYLAAGREMGHHPHPTGADDVLADAQAAGRGAQTLRPVVAGDRDPCRGALPGRGEGRHDQMVGADHSRILRRHRRPGLHRLQQPGMAGASRHRRPRAARRSAYPRREHASPARWARRARCGSRPRRRSNISTIRTRPRRRARPTAA